MSCDRSDSSFNMNMETMDAAIWMTMNSKGKATISELMMIVTRLANNAVRESMKVRVSMVTIV
ncbi:hypothetical protein SDC9_142832 [bioreactor metagenome]|uniref:Uncharacterized protein n=1 Tax=bioreactor metagenome TaxID=1076179 RepID=A0A645E1X3_9ZZZZ